MKAANKITVTKITPPYLGVDVLCNDLLFGVSLIIFYSKLRESLIKK